MGKQVLLSALLSALLVVIVASPAAYMLARYRAPGLGAIDLAQLIDEHEEKVTLQLSKPGLTDSERGAIQARSETFVRSLGQMIDALPDECNCVVLNRAAILSGQVEDLTPLIRDRVSKW
jgi:hypothetical protein